MSHNPSMSKDTALPKDTSDEAEEQFDFTHIIYIAPHFSADSSIKIYDLTGLVTEKYPSEAFNARTEQLGQQKLVDTPTWVIHDPRFWKQTTLHPGSISTPKGHEDTVIASWTPSRWVHGKNHIDFPAGSKHCGHSIVMERHQFMISRAEGFVQNSVQYFWRHDKYSRRRLTLWKVIMGEERVAAKYKAPYRFPRTGGTLAVDTREIDLVVAFMTCIAMLRKVRRNEA